MKILVACVGSRGDVQPYVALGAGLQQAGHEVTIAADPAFRDFIAKTGLAFAEAKANPQKALEKDIKQLGNNPLQVLRFLSQQFQRVSEEHFRDMLAAAAGVEAIVYSNLAFAGLHVAEALGIPVIATSLQPIVATRAYPYSISPILPEWFPFKGVYNKLSYLSTRLFLRLVFKPTNVCRKKILNLPPIAWKYYQRLDFGAYPFLYGYSAHVLPKPDDWPDTQHVTGYWFLKGQADWQPPGDLSAFLDADEPPVYIGFGSMVDQEAEDLTRLVVDALAMAGQRAVLLGGWANLGGADLPASIFKVDDIPHEWLFRRVKAVVHHGGAGTTAAGLRAGKPSVIVPFFSDQPFWGWRVQKLGAGPRPIPRKKLTPQRLAQAIASAVQDQDIRSRAEELGEKLRAEDGVANAVDLINALLPEPQTLIPHLG
jgi:sterol 3beta-glucosyltransferase